MNIVVVIGATPVGTLLERVRKYQMGFRGIKHIQMVVSDCEPDIERSILGVISTGRKVQMPMISPKS